LDLNITYSSIFLGGEAGVMIGCLKEYGSFNSIPDPRKVPEVGQLLVDKEMTGELSVQDV